MLAGPLKEKLRKGDIAVATWMIFDFWPGYLEIYKKAGFDAVVLDLEHGSVDHTAAEDICREARLLDLPLILRSEASLYHLLRKYIDLGPAGLMLPWVETAEQVQTLRDAMFCAPYGRRGPGGAAVMGVNSLDRAGWAEVEENLFAMLQVETPAGVENMTSIMNHDWIDSVCLGPYDLSLNMGHCCEMDHPDVVAAITRVIQQAAGMGKPCAMPVGSATEARFWLERGSKFFIYGEATSAAREKGEEFLKAIHE